MRRAMFAVGGLLAGTTMLVAVKTPPDAFQSPATPATPATPAAGNQVTPSPEGPGPTPEGSAAPPEEEAEEREGSGGSRSGRNTGGNSGGNSGGGQTIRVDGPAVDNDHGTVQVRITMTGDRLVAVEALQMPTSSPRSVQLSARVTEDLGAAAVRQQSADLDAVSGASSTSASYLKSLQGALDAAAQQG